MQQAVKNVLDMVARAIIGKENVITSVFLAILARGHILLEDIPGVGKTTLALAFSKALSLDYSRVQFNPDVLPSDITGFSVYNKETGTMNYTKGAVICNLFLADELNRATSRTQSALLEAMEEGAVTVDGTRHKIPEPFTVIATQNPIGAAGTQLLPDSQLDRFMVRLSLGYPTFDEEVSLIERKQSANLLDNVMPVLSRTDLEGMRDYTARVYISQEIVKYIVYMTGLTRRHPAVMRGASPRASISLAAMAKALAFASGRDYVTPKDIAPIFIDSLAHRLLIKPEAVNKNISAEYVLNEIFKSVRAPQASA